MLKSVKSLTKFLVPIALINSSVFAQTGFFVGGSINIQQNAYSKGNSSVNTPKNNINNVKTAFRNIQEDKFLTNDLIKTINVKAEDLHIRNDGKGGLYFSSDPGNQTLNPIEFVSTMLGDQSLHDTLVRNKGEVTTPWRITNITFSYSLNKVINLYNSKQIDEKKLLPNIERMNANCCATELTEVMNNLPIFKDTNGSKQFVAINEENKEYFEVFFSTVLNPAEQELVSAVIELGSKTNIDLPNVSEILTTLTENGKLEDGVEKNLALSLQINKVLNANKDENGKKVINGKSALTIVDIIKETESDITNATNIFKEMKGKSIDPKLMPKIANISKTMGIELDSAVKVSEIMNQSKSDSETAKKIFDIMEKHGINNIEDAHHVLNKNEEEEREELERQIKAAEEQKNELEAEKKQKLEAEKLLEEAKKELAAKKQEELSSIKSSASKISPSVSLLAGYGVKVNNFGFITEAGIDLNFGKVGDNSKKELEVKNIYNIYLTQKVGYYFNENNLTYITGGLSIKDNKISYTRNNISMKEEKKITPNLILGIGYQRTLTRNWAMFTEFNHIVSLSKVKTEAGEVKTRSEQVRIGARYYF